MDKIYFAVGDVVKVFLDHMNVTHVVKITKKEMRYSGNSKDPIDFFITGMLLEPTPCHSCKSDEPHEHCPFCDGTGTITKVMCASRFVTERISIGKAIVGKFENMYSPTSSCRGCNYVVKTQKKTATGEFYNLVCWAVGKLKHEVVRPVSYNRAIELYSKSRMGLINFKPRFSLCCVEEDNFVNDITDTSLFDRRDIVVDKEKFVRWVAKNLDKILMTRKEMIKASKEDEDEWNKMYEEDLRRDLEEEYGIQALESDTVCDSSDPENIFDDFENW